MGDDQEKPRSREAAYLTKGYEETGPTDSEKKEKTALTGKKHGR